MAVIINLVDIYKIPLQLRPISINIYQGEVYTKFCLTAAKIYSNAGH